MGCSVIWAYWDLYRREGISRIVMVDQVPVCTNNPVWTDAEKDQAGGVFDPTGLYDAANGITGPDGVRVSEGFVSSMFTAAMPAEALRLTVAEALKLPREPAARLLINPSYSRHGRDSLAGVA
jgi:non-heme chloroperoxidase